MSSTEQVSQTDKNLTIDDSEAERLRRDIFRPDREKFRLFTQMLRNNAIYKRAKVTHK